MHFLMKVQLGQKLLSFVAIPAVMPKGAHALYSLPLEMVPLWLEWGRLASGTLMASTDYVPRLENFKP